MMLKRLLPILCFFFLTGLTLITAFSYHNTLAQSQKIERYVSGTDDTNEEIVNYSGLAQTRPKRAGEVLGVVTIFDNRADTLERFFQRYGSPLASHAKFFVEVADKYKLDYRLLPAIALQESGGGRYIPHNSYNAWGYAITETQTLGFLSWEQGIDRVARGIKTEYVDKGLVTPDQIMTKYTPASLEKGGAWAKGVSYFMGQMQ